MRHEPWIALGMSRATWYRLGKPEKKPEPRMTQARFVKIYGPGSVRTFQRSLRIARSAPDLMEQLDAGTLKVGPAEQIVREREEAAALACIRELRRE